MNNWRIGGKWMLFLVHNCILVGKFASKWHVCCICTKLFRREISDQTCHWTAENPRNTRQFWPKKLGSDQSTWYWNMWTIQPEVSLTSTVFFLPIYTPQFSTKRPGSGSLLLDLHCLSRCAIFTLLLLLFVYISPRLLAETLLLSWKFVTSFVVMQIFTKKINFCKEKRANVKE